ncbi:hypothetical protein N9992_00175 [bacterium]|nr:hypothetical protein [bacterium]
MANEFKVRKGLIVQGSGSTGDNTILDVQGNQGQLFSITDSLEGTLFSVSDISGIPILDVNSNETVKIGTFGSEGLIVNGSNITSSGNISASGTITANAFIGDGSSLTSLPSQTDNNFTTTLKNKLDGISTSADVTDATTVAAAGALMDSEVTNLAQVKAFDSSDYATAAQGTKADNALPKAGGTMTGTLQASTLEGASFANRFRKMSVLPGGYVEPNALNFRFDESQTAYAGESHGIGGTINQTSGTTIPDANLKKLFTFTASYINLNTYKDGSGNVVIELTDISLTNSANTSWRPYVFFHSAASNVASMTIELKDNDGNWETVENAIDCIDFYMYDGFYTLSPGTLKGARFTFTNITGNSYLRMIGVIGKTVEPYQWNVLKSGGKMFGDLDFGDSKKVTFGNSEDLKLYHDGSNSYIDDTGTGDLRIRTTNGAAVKIQYGGESMIQANANSSVDLYHNNSKKLETTSTGVDITGNVVVSGTVDGRDIATDGTKLDGIATGADVTPSWVPSTNPNYLTDYTVTSGDVTAHEGDITITESQISDLGNYATGDNFDADGTFASLRAQGTTKDDVGLGNVANESRATILGGNLTGTINSVAVATVTAGAALGATSNQDSTATIRSGTTAANVGLGNVTNESKATMFASPTFTGTTAAPTPSANDDSTKIATTAYVQQELTDLIGTAPAALDTLGELSASLANDQDALASLTTTVGTKLAKSSNLSDLADAGTARTNLGVDAAGTDNSTDVTLAGSYDYITISGQTITRNQVDYNTDIANTPTIPTNNNQLTNGAGFTTNTGTVTNLTVGTGLDVSNGTTTPSITLDLSEFTDMTQTMVSTDEFIVLDSGAERRKAASEIGLSIFSNNAGFLTRADLTRDVINILPIANGGTGATTAGAALTALGAAASNHNHDASDINSGTLAEARIPNDMDSGKVKQICTSHHNFFMNSPSTTADFFIPYNNLNESSNPTNSIYYNRMVAPYDGRIVKVVLHTTAAIGTACQVLFWVATSSGTFAPSAAETVTGVDLNTANSSATATFSTTSTAEFDEGDVLGVSIIKSLSTTANMQVTVVWEYTV